MEHKSIMRHESKLGVCAKRSKSKSQETELHNQSETKSGTRKTREQKRNSTTNQKRKWAGNTLSPKTQQDARRTGVLGQWAIALSGKDRNGRKSVLPDDVNNGAGNTNTNGAAQYLWEFSPSRHLRYEHHPLVTSLVLLRQPTFSCVCGSSERTS